MSRWTVSSDKSLTFASELRASLPAILKTWLRLISWEVQLP